MNNHRLLQFSRAVRESTLKRLVQVPSGFENWKIVDGSLSVSEIAKHILDCDYWLFKKLKNESLKSITPEPNSLIVQARQDYDILLNNLIITGKQREELIINLNSDEMDRKIFDDRFNNAVSVWWIIVRGNIDHEIHHRGQIALYLKVLRESNNLTLN